MCVKNEGEGLGKRGAEHTLRVYAINCVVHALSSMTCSILTSLIRSYFDWLVHTASFSSVFATIMYISYVNDKKKV